MEPESTSLADEERMGKAAALDVATGGHRQRGGPDRSAAAARVRAARTRFLPYLAAGAAVACGYLSVVDAGSEHLADVFGTAVTAGIVVGMAIGWLLLGLYQRRAERSATARRRVDLTIVLLTVPAYVVAGWTSALVGWAAAVAMARPTPELSLPNAWPMLIVASLVLYPTSYAFARRQAERPDNFIAAVVAANREINENPRSFVVLGDFLIGLAWCIGSLFAIFGLLVGVQVVFAPQLAGTSIHGALAAVVFLLTWVGVTAAGTVWTVRRISRRRGRGR